MLRYGLKEVIDAIFYDSVTGKPKLFFNTLKMSNLETSADSVYANGGQGSPRLIGWDFNKTQTLTMQDALVSPESLGMLAGEDAKTGVALIEEREETVVASVDTTEGTATITAKNPVKSAIANTFVYKTHGAILGTELIVETIADVTITIDNTTAGLVVGDAVSLFYTFESGATAKTVTISADKFPGYYKVVGKTLLRAESGADEKFQVVIHKAKLQPNFTLTMDSENVSVFDFNLDIFKAVNSKSMVELIKY